MSGRGQVAGACGHRKGVYDTHPDCLKCSGCTRQRKCRFCDAWTAQDWESVALARTHASRKKSGCASSGSTVSTDPSPVPPPVPAGDLTSHAPSISGRSTTSVSSRSRWDMFNMNKQNKISCTNDDLLLQRGRGLPPIPKLGANTQALGPKLEVPRSPQGAEASPPRRERLRNQAPAQQGPAAKAASLIPRVRSLLPSLSTRQRCLVRRIPNWTPVTRQACLVTSRPALAPRYLTRHRGTSHQAALLR